MPRPATSVTVPEVLTPPRSSSVDQLPSLRLGRVGQVRSLAAQRLAGPRSGRSRPRRPAARNAAGRPCRVDLHDDAAVGGLPAASRSPAVSMPCATALRTTCSRRLVHLAEQRAARVAGRRRGAVNTDPLVRQRSRRVAHGPLAAAVKIVPAGVSRSCSATSRARRSSCSARSTAWPSSAAVRHRRRPGGCPPGGAAGSAPAPSGRPGVRAAWQLRRQAPRRRSTRGESRAAPGRAGRRPRPMADSSSSISAVLAQAVRPVGPLRRRRRQPGAGAADRRRPPSRRARSSAATSARIAVRRGEQVADLILRQGRLLRCGASTSSTAWQSCGDLGLLHHPRRALERVRAPAAAGRPGPRRARRSSSSTPLSSWSSSSRASIAEVPVGIVGHRLTTRAAGRTSRSSSVDRSTRRAAVCRVCPALASVSRVVCATLFTADVDLLDRGGLLLGGQLDLPRRFAGGREQVR